jgi:hypothetical protein
MRHFGPMILIAMGMAGLNGQTPPPAQPAKPGGPPPGRQRIVPPARITKFVAQPEAIQPGQAVMLVWSTENPNSVTLDPGVGRVTARGSRQANPARTTTYTLTVLGPNNAMLTQTVKVSVAGTTEAASDTAATAAKREVPTIGGKPDLSGVYNFGGGGRPGAPGADAPPALKAGAEKFKVVRGPNDSGLYSDCMPTGVPGAYSVPYQWQIVQGPDKVVILYEYPHLFRVIPTHGGPHQADLDPTWMGDSIGHWEGDTLVVDVTAFNDKTELPGGFKHTESLHVVERFRRADFDSLQYEATVEDPNVFEKPWKMTRTFALRPELEKVDEFVCENNRDYSKFFAK